MPPQPWCTIVIPTYDGKRYLPYLIDSLKRQDKAGDVLWLFIDDASTDDSAEISRQSGLEPAIFLSNSQNIGLYASINKALSIVRSEYVALMFQDDIAADTYLQQMRSLVEQYPEVAFLWAAIDGIDENGRSRVRGLDSGRIELIWPGVSPWRGALNRGTFWTISGSLSRSDALRRYGFCEDFPHCSDYEFLLRALRKETFLYFERPLMKIRFHSNQASAENLGRSRDLQERIDIYQRQWAEYPADSDMTVRIRSSYNLCKGIIIRAVGQAKRGNVTQACSTLALLTRALALML